MSSIYDAVTLQELVWRIEKLNSNSQSQWGKMNVAQMLAHCSAVLEVALGDKTLKRGLFSVIFGKLFKPMITNEQPFKPNMPTSKEFIITDKMDFNIEKERLLALLIRFSKSGTSVMQNRVHPFFGKLTAEEWSTSQLKHLDHHLRQFGA